MLVPFFFETHSRQDHLESAVKAIKDVPLLGFNLEVRLMRGH
jgi:hypothetical protein